MDIYENEWSKGCLGLQWARLKFGTLCHIYPARHYQTSRISHREYAISF